MSDVKGSMSIGDGFSLVYDFNGSTSDPELTVYLEFTGGIKLASATLTEDDASASLGASEGGYTAEVTATANWSTQTLSYSATIASSFPKGKKSYSGSTKF